MNYSLFSAVSVWINFWMANSSLWTLRTIGKIGLKFFGLTFCTFMVRGCRLCKRAALLKPIFPHSFSVSILSQSVIRYQRSDLVFYQSSNHSLVTPTFGRRDRGDLIRSIKQPKWRLLETILLKTSLKTYALMLWLFYQLEDVVWEWILRFLSRYIIDLYQKDVFSWELSKWTYRRTFRHLHIVYVWKSALVNLKSLFINLYKVIGKKETSTCTLISSVENKSLYSHRSTSAVNISLGAWKRRLFLVAKQYLERVILVESLSTITRYRSWLPWQTSVKCLWNILFFSGLKYTLWNLESEFSKEGGKAKGNPRK